MIEQRVVLVCSMVWMSYIIHALDMGDMASLHLSSAILDGNFYNSNEVNVGGCPHSNLY